ncbi:MAG: replicative DNA helicase, partial [Bacteroidales bacterium]|nr:replicative DNA helicase [Bacteroidales bacterium]
MPAKTKKETKPSLENLGLEIGNKPPQALEVEAAVLGAMLLEPTCVDLAMEELGPDCFYDQKYRMVFEAMSALVNEHTSVDIITVSAKLREMGNLETVGGSVVLADLSEKVGSAAHIEYYLKILKQKTIQRELISASYDILKNSFDDAVNVDELIDMAQTKVFDAIQSNVRREVQEIGSVINEAMVSLQGMQDQSGLNGVPSGFVSIDQITMGWQPSDLIILAARPSVGKTAFALNLARNAAVDHHMGVAVFSLEMSAIQLAKRLMVSESGLGADKIKGGVKLEPYEWQQ